MSKKAFKKAMQQHHVTAIPNFRYDGKNRVATGTYRLIVK